VKVSVPCTPACNLPLDWGARLHDMLELLVTTSSPVVMCQQILVMMQSCDGCVRYAEQAGCLFGDECCDVINLLRLIKPHYPAIRTLLRQVYCADKEARRFAEIDFFLLTGSFDSLSAFIEKHSKVVYNFN